MKVAQKLDGALVAIHAQALLAAGIDKSKFNAALNAIVRDKSVTAGEWAGIANTYRNAPTNGDHVYKFDTVKAAQNAIQDTFGERLEAASKRGIIDRITHWAS